MPYYVVKGQMRQVEKPDLPNLPDWEAGQLPEFPGRPEFPGFPERPGQGLPPQLPPKEEWPPLPPFLQPGVGLPIPPSPEYPMVPVDPPIVDPPDIWPPLRPDFPEMPDLSGKTLILARFYVSRHVNFLRWVVIDHAEVKAKIEKAKQWLKDNMPAGGIGGVPPGRPQPH